MDWNDVRHFLAVADSGSTLAAGRALRVSQTTVGRRINALEAALGVALFDRSPSGYHLTEAGADLIEPARAIERAAHALIDAAAARQRDVSGTVRVTAQELCAVTILPAILRDLHAAFPAIRIEMDTSDGLRDLGAGAADIALRTSVHPTGAGLVGRRLCDDLWTLYCSRSYSAEHGHPSRRSEVAGHPLIGGGEGPVWTLYRAWLQENGLEGDVVMHNSTATGLLAAVRSGLGLAMLPCIVASNDPDLLRCLPPMRVEERGLWLLTHERVRHAPRVRAVIDFLYARLAALVPD